MSTFSQQRNASQSSPDKEMQLTVEPISQVGDERTNVDGQADITLIGQSQTTSFDDAVGFHTMGKKVNKEFDDVPDDKRLLMSLRPPEEVHHSIETILSRPVKISTFNFGTDNTRGTLLLPGIDITTELRTKNYFRLAREKLSGFYGFRCRAHLKVTLNPQPFEAGLFQIYFVPFMQFSSSMPKTLQNPEALLPFSTGCPNVMCNVSLQSEVELSVPYTGPVPFINLTNQNADFGTFFVQSVSPLTDSTSKATCEMSAYMYFTEVELFGATPHSWPVNPVQRMELQGPISQVTSKQQPAEEESWGKSLRSFLNTSATKGIGSILDLLGLSKPTQAQVVQRFIMNPYSLQPTADSVTGATKYSFMSEQNTKITQLGIDTQDEMDINHFIRKPTYLTSFKWSTDQENMTKLVVLQSEPNGFISTKQGDFTCTAPTRLRYVANTFSYWRGTNEFTFIIVATKFHSGRIRLVYTLGGEFPGSIDDLPYTFSQVLDLRDGFMFKVKCPFFASAPWRCVPQQWSLARNYYESVPSDAALQDRPNTLTVLVENELRASPNVDQQIEFIVLQSGGDDYQFAGPRSPVFFPMLAENPARVQKMQLQGPYDGDLDIPVVDMTAAVASLAPTATHPEDITFGESIQNIREMLKRYHLMGNCPMGKTATDLPQDLVLAPWYSLIARTENDRIYDWFSYYWPCYKMARGGMRFQFVQYQTDYNLIIRFEPDMKAFPADPSYAMAIGPAGLGTFTFPFLLDTGYKYRYKDDLMPISATTSSNMRLQGGQEIEVPYYHRMHKMVTVLPTQTEDLVTKMLAEQYPPSVVLISNNIQTEDESAHPLLTIFRAVADDFNLGYLLGCPLTRVDWNVAPTPN